MKIAYPLTILAGVLVIHLTTLAMPWAWSTQGSLKVSHYLYGIHACVEHGACTTIAWGDGTVQHQIDNIVTSSADQCGDAADRAECADRLRAQALFNPLKRRYEAAPVTSPMVHTRTVVISSMAVLAVVLTRLRLAGLLLVSVINVVMCAAATASWPAYTHGAGLYVFWATTAVITYILTTLFVLTKNDDKIQSIPV